MAADGAAGPTRGGECITEGSARSGFKIGHAIEVLVGAGNKTGVRRGSGVVALCAAESTVQVRGVAPGGIRMAVRAAAARLVGCQAVSDGLGNSVICYQVRQGRLDGTGDLTVVKIIDGVEDQLLRIGRVVGIGPRLVKEQDIIEGRSHGIGPCLVGAPVGVAEIGRGR